MNRNLIFWIGLVVYFAIGIACAIVYANDPSEDTREEIASLAKPRSRAGRKLLGSVILLALFFWPIWFPIYWISGAEDREAAEAERDYRRRHPEAEPSDDADRDA